MSSTPFDPRKDASDYIKKKRVDSLFQELGTRLVYERAADPNEFLISVLKEMQENKKSQKPTQFFTEADITTLFEMFDPTGKGSITVSQYKQALQSLGIDEPTVALSKNAVEANKVDRATFMRDMGQEARALSMT